LLHFWSGTKTLNFAKTQNSISNENMTTKSFNVSTANKELFIIRHAHVAYKTELGDRYKVQIYEEHLSPLGWAQALELDYLLTQSGLQFEKIYSSDYCRAVETITPFATRNKLVIEENPLLRELKIKGDYNQYFEQSKLNKDFKNDGGQSFNEGALRLNREIELILASFNSKAILVTHGVLMEAFIDRYFKKTFQFGWPDVFKLSLVNNKYISIERVENLVPKNSTDHSKLGFYPEI
jgi:2,3-bisphosphoglycerate-dependent phosphoglycerate mutase